MTSPIPTSEEQVYFLRNIQRLLAEGQFVASYKFALVRALADLSVLKGEDSGTPLELDTRDIAAKFVELYWRQSRPFQLTTGTSGLILQQNTGRQASIVSKIVDAQHACMRHYFDSNNHSRIAGQNWLPTSIKLSELCRCGNCRPLETSG